MSRTYYVCKCEAIFDDYDELTEHMESCEGFLGHLWHDCPDSNGWWWRKRRGEDAECVLAEIVPESGNCYVRAIDGFEVRATHGDRYRYTPAPFPVGGRKDSAAATAIDKTPPDPDNDHVQT